MISEYEGYSGRQTIKSINLEIIEDIVFLSIKINRIVDQNHLHILK